MPCQDSLFNPVADSLVRGHYAETKRLHAKNDSLAEMLCYVMRYGGPCLATNNICLDDQRIKKNLERWWDNHQKLDQSRKRK